MDTQANIAHTIIDKGADFLLAVKGNQENLQKTITAIFTDTSTANTPSINIENSHGIAEYHEATVVNVSSELFDEK